MSLQETLKSDALALVAQASADDSLAPFRQRHRNALEAISFPDRKTERWKYTSLKALESGHLKRALANDESDSPFPDLGGITLVVRNGVVETANAQLPAGVILSSLSETPELADTDMQSLFGTINGAALDDGMLIDISADAEITTPLHIVHVADADTPGSTQLRLVVRIGRNARASIIEHYQGQGPALTNAVSRYLLAENAALTHYRLSAEAEEALHVGLLEFELARDSQVNSFQLMPGCALRRNDVHAVMAGSGADLNMKGVFIARRNSHIDNQVCVEHRVPHCTSDQVYKGMAGESGKGVFNGRIHIHEGARGTNAELSNQNLLLNPGAEIDSKPELEIYNDDVKCAHGTTVGQMDATQLFYLQSRGIDAHAAKRMLAEGFVNELINAIPHDSVREWVAPWLAESLTEGL